MTAPATGKKFDGGKPPIHLLDPQALELIADVFGYGQGKYGPWNWKGGIQYSRIFSAIMRHLWAFWRGEDNDPETGKSHLAHAGCGIFMLLWHSLNRKDLDDRWKPEDKLTGFIPNVQPQFDDKRVEAPAQEEYLARLTAELAEFRKRQAQERAEQALKNAAIEQYSFYGGGILETQK